MRSVVASLLKGMGITLATNGEARLLVTDTPESLNGFLDKRPERRAVAFGGESADRMHGLPSSPRVTELREALRAAVDVCYPEG
jgi:hypothetical protein